jgi:hypothetical protein
MAHDVLVGTASWTEPTLIKSGRFYPPEARSAEDRLRYYASQFPVVEVDSSFYALPSFNNSVLWVNRTPEDFMFDVKLFRVFTLHQTPLKSLPPEVREEVENLATKTGNVYYKDLPKDVRERLWSLFLEGIEPLKSAGKLGLPASPAPAVGYQEPRQRSARRGVPGAPGRVPGGDRVQERDLAFGAQPCQHGLHAAGDERANGDRGRAARVREQHSSSVGSDIDGPGCRPVPRS